MDIRCGYNLTFTCSQPVPIILQLRVHPSREADLIEPDTLHLDPAIPAEHYQDMFGNLCTRILAPVGATHVSSDFVVRDSGEPDRLVPDAEQIPVELLPAETLVFLMGSRYCDTDHLTNQAWTLFGHTRPGWERVQAICDYVHERISFGYQHARATRSASEGHSERLGVCRDFAHLAVTFCRCMNIPARYCTGYLGDIGIPFSPDPMDFSAWFEVYLGGQWYTFDARHNFQRIGRIVIGRGRDATDVAISTSFGAARLTRFEVTTYEIGGPSAPQA